MTEAHVFTWRVATHMSATTVLLVALVLVYDMEKNQLSKLQAKLWNSSLHPSYVRHKIPSKKIQRTAPKHVLEALSKTNPIGQVQR